MKMKLLAGLAIGLFMFGMIDPASAIIYTGMQDITSSGQSFQFNELSAETSSGTGLFTIEVNGDFFNTPSCCGDEDLAWDIDTLVFGVNWNAENADESIIAFPDDVWWKKTIIIDAATLLNITSDGMFQVNIVNGADVNPFNFIDQDWVSYTLEYDMSPVPEPSTMLLLGLGLAGLIGIRARKKK